MLKYLIYILICVLVGCAGCSEKQPVSSRLAIRYGQIQDVRYTPDSTVRCRGWFTDAGAWYGFTLPETDKWVNGFCGPFHLDMNRRTWVSRSLVQAGFASEEKGQVYQPDSVSYFPGELYLSSHSQTGQIEQRLIFVDKSTALLTVTSDTQEPFRFTGEFLPLDIKLETDKNHCVLTWPSGEGVVVTFSPEMGILPTDRGYETLSLSTGRTDIVLSFFEDTTSLQAVLQQATQVLSAPDSYRAATAGRWEHYLSSVLREDLPEKYNRVAVKAVVTLVSNWKSARGDLHHDGVVPSHAVGYFLGFWGWDSWKHAVALSRFAPALAKDQLRAMFDYQTPEGMIIDCIYSDAAENNARNSKPPLASWAVDEIFKATGDSAFVKEMYPKLLTYYRWWFRNRDHNQNGICEFGACDGTLEAAAWESGMDNAIRFDHSQMLPNGPDAWSLDQESVDLNAFLAYEHRLLSRLAPVAGEAFNEPDRLAGVNDYFFSPEQGFFFDRRLDGTFVLEEGTEACIPLWTGIATKEQAAAAARLFMDTAKFATYIPFPTIAADNPKFMPAGYWRGPIWLDQVYFGIDGLRKYGYKAEADAFTCQVFDRLQGLTADAPIHENYDTHNGGRLKAPHFSWSAAHLLLLYEALNK